MLKEIKSHHWQASFNQATQQEAIASLESGSIILLPQLDFTFDPDEKIFFSTAYSTNASKNISYNIKNGELRGVQCQELEKIILARMMHRYVESARSLMQQLFPTYKNDLQVGRTSFRPVEIKGRIPKSYRKDDTRLHVDAFPASPLQGRRIIRVFTNVNPYGASRVWHVGEPFEHVAKQFLPKIRRSWFGRGLLLQALRLTRGFATEYDYAMLQLHNMMKADLGYQKSAAQQAIQFQPQSSWIVQTDHVSHAALAGQYVLEQTFYLPVHAMQTPSYSPLKILERLMGRALCAYPPS
jgi:hypothetical protein